MNKKIGILTFALLLSISAMASAKESMCDKMKIEGGYIASQADISTVNKAQTMEDDSYVTLQGQIEKRVKKDKYQFKDQTGTMMVEINKKIWKGQVISADDTVQITGEIDKNKDGVMLDVESLIKK